MVFIKQEFVRSDTFPYNCSFPVQGTFYQIYKQHIVKNIDWLTECGMTDNDFNYVVTNEITTASHGNLPLGTIGCKVFWCFKDERWITMMLLKNNNQTTGEYYGN